MPKASAQTSPRASRARAPGTALLGAAATAIAESGWGNVTAAEVAALAGVNRAWSTTTSGRWTSCGFEAALHVLATTVEGPALALLDPGPLAAG
ncbi:MAG: hypothetical protein R2701_03655 [Acidimicrobiales bacterium]